MGLSALLVLTAAAMWIAYRSHLRVRRGAARVEQLYEFSQAISSSLSLGAADFMLLERTSSVLGVEHAELVVDDGNSATFVTLHDGNLSVLNGAHADGARQAHEEMLHGREIAHTGTWMAARLHPGTDMYGSLVVHGRVEARKFTKRDVQLFGTLASHGSTCLANHRLVQLLRAESEERHHLAMHDSLTGLPNRARLDAVLRTTLTERFDHESVVVMLIDLDRFKEVNDTLGHHHGDVLLCKFATRIRDAVDQGTLVARLGGDEFALVYRTTDDRNTIRAHAEDIERQLVEPFELADLMFEVGCSIGIALAPDDGLDPAVLLQRADVAMYAAKRGAGRCEFYSPVIDHASPYQLALAAELRRVIDTRGLFVEYQPKARLPSGDICGVEALARWHHPQHGFIAPDEFIAIAERNGLIGPLTESVLDIALGQLAAWRLLGIEIGMSVNVSTRNVLDEALPAIVRETLDRHRLPASALTLEITESTLITDPARTVATLTALGEIGVRIAIDDFGTGYSSLAYLHRLPVDELKIDESFIEQLTSDGDDSVIVRSTIELGHSLGLRVTAEGVEDGQTWQLLAAAGCDQAQGFFLRQSGTGAQLTRWLRQRSEEQRALRQLVEPQPATSTTVRS